MIETQLEDARSRQGVFAQMAAQQRIIQGQTERSRARRIEVQRQLIETCHHSSAVRSINLSKHVNPTWSEGKNSYRIVTKLTEKDKRRLN